MRTVTASLVFAILAIQGVAGWRDGMNLSAAYPIENQPVIEVTESQEGYTVTLANKSSVKLYYTGRAEGAPDIFVERMKKGRWDDNEWDWCGTGKREYSLRAGESLTVMLPRSLVEPRGRAFILLREKPNRASLLKLLEITKEPKHPTQPTPPTGD